MILSEIEPIVAVDPTSESALPRLLRAAMEARMKLDLSEVKPIAERIEAMYVEYGRREGRQEGRQEGELRGRLEAARAMFRRLATERGFSLSTAQEARLCACSDPERITAWAVRLLKASSLDEALD